MAKAISQAVNRQIIEEYVPGQISQKKLAKKFGVSTAHVYRILKSDRLSCFDSN